MEWIYLNPFNNSFTNEHVGFSSVVCTIHNNAINVHIYFMLVLLLLLKHSQRGMAGSNGIYTSNFNKFCQGLSKTLEVTLSPTNS